MLAPITEALRRGDHAAALAAARAAVAAEPENASAHHLLGLALQRNNDPAGALAAIDRAIALAPDRAVYQLSRAAMAIGQRDLEAAERGMRETVALDPNQLEAYVALVHLALARGENEEAARQLKLAQRVDPDHPQVLLAEGYVAQFTGQADHALRCFTNAVERDPKLPLAQYALGMAYLGRGHWSFAEQALRNALMLQADNPGALRGLVQSLLQQQKPADALGLFDAWLIRHPRDGQIRAQRGELRLGLGQTDAAQEDFQMLLDAEPGHVRALNGLVSALASRQEKTQAIAAVEAALAKAPEQDGIWSLRFALRFSDVAKTTAFLARWRQAQPASVLALEASAQISEATGEFDQAENFADQALSRHAGLPAAQFVKLRAELRRDPRQALLRLERLAAAATTPEAQRMVLAWRGLSYDRLGQPAEAAETWRQMLRYVLPLSPLPKPMPAEQVPEAGATGILLWAPAGVRPEQVFESLSPLLGARLLADRNLPQARQDGFGHLRAFPGTPGAGTAERWRQAILDRGLDPAEVVDWLPQWDAYTAAALAGARLVVLLTDPRDAFMNWMVYGSAQAYGFMPDAQNSAEWMAQSLEMLADQVEADANGISLIRLDAMHKQPESVAQALELALGLSARPDPTVLAREIQALGGIANQFPPGHWRRYREAFATEIARLTPVATRLGYPAE